MTASNILPFEQVEVLNLNNGARFTTYAIEDEETSGVIGINGAAARLTAKGDILIIVSYCQLPDDKAKIMAPAIVHVDRENKIVRQGRAPSASLHRQAVCP
jgi:aspartate 1-decarboxylase